MCGPESSRSTPGAEVSRCVWYATVSCVASRRPMRNIAISTERRSPSLHLSPLLLLYARGERAFARVAREPPLEIPVALAFGAALCVFSRGRSCRSASGARYANVLGSANASPSHASSVESRTVDSFAREMLSSSSARVSWPLSKTLPPNFRRPRGISEILRLRPTPIHVYGSWIESERRKYTFYSAFGALHARSRILRSRFRID